MARYQFTNKKDFERYFRQEILPAVREKYEQDRQRDIPARREEWNNHIDALVKDGALPEKAMDWACPW